MSFSADDLERALRKEFRPIHLTVTDDSARHAGHAGAAGGGGHYLVVLVSERFEGLSRLEQHRAVYRALGPLMGTSVHALGLRTAAPSAWEGEGGGAGG